ncbi:MAG TPA: NAD-dependent epimerase/dehydratase family protein [Euryarchaeota archaeon]|nr:NAD-dependent epimerase/dehydratase family protein [Euryarchaeota archaeon]
MAKYLVTGASGQIGSYVLERLLDRAEVIGVDLRPSGIKEINDFIILGDLRSREFVEKIVKDVDVIIHLAAQVSVERSWEDPIYDAENNILATINLLKEASERNIEKFVYISSAAVYGMPKYIPIDEDHPKNPLSPYGVSKLAGEYYCKAYSGDFYTIIIRPFNVFSPRMDPKSPYSGVIAKFVQRVKKGLPPIIYGSGRQTRDFVHVKDVVDFIEIAIRKGERGEAYNVGTGEETSILELAEMIIEIGGFKGKPIFEKPRKGDIERSVADITKAKRIGFRPKTDLKRDLEEVFELMEV